MHVCILVKRSLLLFDFNQNWNMSINFNNTSQNMSINLITLPSVKFHENPFSISQVITRR